MWLSSILVIIVGVLARLSSDFGLQFGEYTVFQHETQVYPRLRSNGAVNSQGYFDLDNMFINGLPDDYHLQFSLKLPSGMPQSIQLASPTKQQDNWGLSYFVYAYVTSASAVEEMLGKQPADHMYWSKLDAGKKSSKVFLSFAKQYLNDPARLTQNPAVGEAKKSSFLSSNEPNMRVVASLDRPAYQYGDILAVDVKISNPRRTKINGIKINVKQLVTMKVGGDPKNVIKTCIGRYTFSNNREDMISMDSGYHHSLSSLRDVEMFSDTLKIRPHIDPMRYLYQLALEARLPRSEQGTPVLASSMDFDGESWPLGGGLDRVRTFSIEYYVNVHIDIPWAKDLIIKLPFKFVNLGTTAGNEVSLPSLGEALSAPIFNNLIPSRSGRASRSGTIIEDLRDLQPVPSNLIKFVDNPSSPGGASSSSATSSPTFDDRVVKPVPVAKSGRSPRSQEPPVGASLGISFKEDLAQAKAGLVQLRVKLAEEQQLVLQNALDAHSLLLRFDPRRHVLVKEFLSVLEEVIITWLPQISQRVSALSLVRSMENLALFDPMASSPPSSTASSPSAPLAPGEDHVAASGLVQNIVGRLGMFHSQLVLFQSPRSVQESKQEALNAVVDDVELMLTRVHNGICGRFDDAGQRITPEGARELIARIQKKALNLVTVIPLYDSFDEELLRLRSKIAFFGLLEEESDAAAPAMVTAWGEDFDPITERLASAFEALSTLMGAGLELSGSRLATAFAEYTAQLIDLLQSVPSFSDRAGVAIFWQWHYLHAIVDTFYTGGLEHSLILPERRSLNWAHRIRCLIPPQWDLVNQHGGGEQQGGARLQIIGTRVIAAMQQLVDTKYEAAT